MKSFSFVLLCALSLPLRIDAASKISVDKIDPPHWWTGMHDTTLQLQVHGSDIRQADFSVDYPGVTIDSVVRLDGTPNWQHVYLNISPETKPGTMTLQWKEGKQTVKRQYELRTRKPQKGAAGFSAADVLYLLSCLTDSQTATPTTMSSARCETVRKWTATTRT